MNGCLANKFVLYPSFSALAKASSVVPVLSRKSLNSLNFLVLLKFLLSGWSTERAINVAPKIVSGLVVKIFILSLLLSISKLISHQMTYQSNFFALI